MPLSLNNSLPAPHPHVLFTHLLCLSTQPPQLGSPWRIRTPQRRLNPTARVCLQEEASPSSQRGTQPGLRGDGASSVAMPLWSWHTGLNWARLRDWTFQRKFQGCWESAKGTDRKQCRALQEEANSQSRALYGRLLPIVQHASKCSPETQIRNAEVFHYHLPVHKCTQIHGQTAEPHMCRAMDASAESIPQHLL